MTLAINTYCRSAHRQRLPFVFFGLLRNRGSQLVFMFNDSISSRNSCDQFNEISVFFSTIFHSRLIHNTPFRCWMTMEFLLRTAMQFAHIYVTSMVQTIACTQKIWLNVPLLIRVCTSIRVICFHDSVFCLGPFSMRNAAKCRRRKSMVFGRNGKSWKVFWKTICICVAMK